MYNDIKSIVGFKSQFGHSFMMMKLNHFFDTIRGPGFNSKETREGIHYKKFFMGTYFICPLMISIRIYN